MEKEDNKVNSLNSPVNFSTDFGVILKNARGILKKTILPTLFSILILALITSLLMTVILPDIKNRYFELVPLHEAILDKINLDETYVLTQDELNIESELSKNTLLNLFLQSSLLYIPLIAIMLLLPSKITNIYSKDMNSAESWTKSIIEPVKTKSKAITAIIILMTFPFILGGGMLLFYFPAIIIMIKFFFSFQSLILDEKTGLDVLKGGRFYSNGNTKLILKIIGISFIIPAFLSSILINPICNWGGITDDKLQLWLNPESRNEGAIFLYYFIITTISNIFYFMFPILHTIAFQNIRIRKIKEMSNSKSNLQNLESPFKNSRNNQEINNIKNGKGKKGEKVKKIYVESGRNKYYCLKCGHKNNLNVRKCSKCGQLYRIMEKK